MLQVTVGTGVNRAKVLISESCTLRDAIAEAAKKGVDIPQTESFTLNGNSVRGSRGDLDRTFAELGASGDVYLLSVKDSQNA